MAPTWLMPKLESSFNLTRNVIIVCSKIMLEEVKKIMQNTWRVETQNKNGNIPQT